jgi:hypothetical protein
MSNQIFVISPTWQNGVLAFDDESRGLRREPFVGGADTILGRLAEGLVGDSAGSGFSLVFSASPFPGHQVRVDRREPEFGGYWYAHETLGRGWLCPALFKYFPEAPESLYLQFKERD